MVEEDGVVVVAAVVVEDIIEIEDLNLYQQNLRLQRLSADFHRIRFKEILTRSSKILRCISEVFVWCGTGRQINSKASAMLSLKTSMHSKKH